MQWPPSENGAAYASPFPTWHQDNNIRCQRTWKEAWWILAAHSLVRRDQNKFVWIRRGPDCLVWTWPRPVTAHSADHEKEKWEGTNTRLRDRKTSRQDELHRWCYNFPKNLRMWGYFQKWLQKAFNVKSWKWLNTEIDKIPLYTCLKQLKNNLNSAFVLSKTCRIRLILTTLNIALHSCA